MEFKDYYDTLGVKTDATDAEIKAAYRRLARKYHPDVSKESGAEEKFKSVNEAYEALREPERRRAYDQLRAGGYRSGDEFRGPPPNWHHAQDAGDGEADFSDFFESLFGRGAGGPQQRRGERHGWDARRQPPEPTQREQNRADAAADHGPRLHGARQDVRVEDLMRVGLVLRVGRVWPESRHYSCGCFSVFSLPQVMLWLMGSVFLHAMLLDGG